MTIVTLRSSKVETIALNELESLSKTISEICLNKGHRVILNHLAIYLGVSKHPTGGAANLKLLNKIKDTTWANGRRHLEKKIRNSKHGDIIIIEEWRQIKIHKYAQNRWVPIMEYNIVDPIILARNAECIKNQDILNKIPNI
jgi:hypothetical protein